ncbi:hypothetical protein [Agromyces bauzanensis]
MTTRVTPVTTTTATREASMVEVLHLAAVLPATVGLCCAVGDRRGRARSVVSAAAMLAAMLAMAAGWPLVPPLVWTAVLLALGVAAAARLRFGRGAVAEPHARDMQLHRALGLVLGAALLVASAAGHGQGAWGHPAHVTSATPYTVALAGAAAYLVFTGWLVVHSVRRRTPVLGAVEASAMGLMTALMALAPLAG